MSKIYTAQDMREEAEFQEGCHGKPNIIATMLRQAADALEREERRVKREKKYEYATVLASGKPSSIHDEKFIRDYHCFRREVGEWEEVRDGK